MGSVCGKREKPKSLRSSAEIERVIIMIGFVLVVMTMDKKLDAISACTYT